MRRLPCAGWSPWPPSPWSARRPWAAPPRAATTARARAAAPARDAAPRLLPQHHPRAGGRRRGEGIFAEKLGTDVKLDRRPSTPARPPSRRSSPVPSTPPTSVRTRRSTPSRSPRVKPSGSSPARPPAAWRWWSSPASRARRT
ncbi:hypothetical protein NKG94_42215 [Micromonospora sp. M12]